MKRYFRLVTAILSVLVILALAGNQAAWAGSDAGSGNISSAQVQSSVSLKKPDPGSVKPPPSDVTVCEDGSRSVGGVSKLTVEDLAPGYCIAAFLRNHAFALGRIPDGAGQVLAHITFVRVFYHGKLVHELPAEDGNVQICYAVPPNTTAQIYFFDFYGPRFGERTAQPAWEPLPTTVENNVACAAAQTSGAYALIGK